MALGDRESKANLGGSASAPNRAPAAKVLKKGLANTRVANKLMGALAGSSIAAAIVATNVSTTVDFAALQVGDLLIHIPATAGNASFAVVAAAGTAPAAAVVGDLYMAVRVIGMDSDIGAAAPLV
jgi:hypothetical protein